MEMQSEMVATECGKTYVVATAITSFAEGEVTFPPGKTWEDVKMWHVKWDRLHASFKDGTDFTAELNSDIVGESDWKYPASATIHEVDKDGKTIYCKEVASQ